MRGPFDEVLSGLEQVAALRCLVRAWRAAPHASLVAAIEARTRHTTDWDLDRFDVTTLPRVLSWLCDSGPFSDQLEKVLDRIEPLLPDPRAAKPLAELAAKNTRAQARIRELAERQALPPTTLDEGGVLLQLKAALSELREHERRFQELLKEESADARAVLADWMMGRGEPLGEFAGLQLGRGAAAASERELALWGQYGVGWIGLFLGEALLRAGNGEAVRSQVRFERGVPVQVNAYDLAVGESLGPGWHHVRELRVRRSYRWNAPSDFEPELAHAVARVEKLDLELASLQLVAQHCAHVRELTVRGATNAWGKLGKLVLTLPALEWVTFDRVATFTARGLASALKSLRERKISVRLQINEAELSIPFSGRPFVTADKELSTEWGKTLEAVHEVTQQRPALRSTAPLPPELESHFLPRDEG